MLQVVVRLVGEARLALALRVQLDEVEGEGLHLGLGLLLQVLPGGCAELAHLRGLVTLPAAVLAHAVQAMDAHVQDVVVAVLQADRLLLAAAGVDGLQSAEHPDAMVDMHDEVAGLQLRELLQCERLRVLAEALLQPVAVVALEDLVVGVERQLQFGIDEAFVQVEHKRREGHLVLHVVEDGVQPLALLGTVAGDQVGVARVLLVVEITRQHLELFRESGLGALGEIHGRLRVVVRTACLLALLGEWRMVIGEWA